MTAQTKVEAATISSALVSALNEIEGVAKSATNPHFKSKYVDLSSVLDAVRPVFARHGLAVTQETSPSEDGVIVETVVLHSSGDERRFGKLYIPANKRDAQGAGSALTYARRYSLMTAFGVPAEDDDGNAAVASNGSAVARPSTGETPPRKSVLDGPYPTLPKLETAIKAFVQTLSKIEDFGEFNAWMGTPEVVELEKQALRDLPSWWETGEGMPEEFVTVAERIHLKKRVLEEADSIHPRTQSVLEAG